MSKSIRSVAVMGLVLISLCFGCKSNSSASPKSVSEDKECKDLFEKLAWQRHHVYCQDLNDCPEPCWQVYREKISRCLRLKGEEVTEEKINDWLRAFPNPSVFEEGRKACLTWGKTDQEREECIKRYSSTCP